MAEFTREAAERLIRDARAFEAMHQNPRPYTRRWPIPNEEEATGCTIVGFCTSAFSQGASFSATVKWTTNSSVAAVGSTITIEDYCGEYYNTSGSACGAAVKAEDGNWYAIRITCYNFDASGTCGGSGSGS